MKRRRKDSKRTEVQCIGIHSDALSMLSYLCFSYSIAFLSAFPNEHFLNKSSVHPESFVQCPLSNGFGLDSCSKSVTLRCHSFRQQAWTARAPVWRAPVVPEVPLLRKRPFTEDHYEQRTRAISTATRGPRGPRRPASA